MTMRRDETTWLYPKLEPYRHQLLRVSDEHEIYVEECGNPQGKPAVFLHGGPGAAASPESRRFFDPRRYRIVVLDQRGCGRSRPHGSLVDNTTAHLVDDLETVRQRLGIDRWLVFGGSWGSTLALAYAQAHPAAVTELVLRGIFLARKAETDWLYREGGASQFFPEDWAALTGKLPPEARADVLGTYYRKLTCGDRPTEVEAAKAFGLWEGRLGTLMPDKDLLAKWGDPAYCWAFARIGTHFMSQGCFLASDDQLLRGVERIRHIPTVIVHGRYDTCCTVKNAFDLAAAWPEAELMVIPDAGHSAFEPGIARALVAATDRFGAASR